MFIKNLTLQKEHFAPKLLKSLAKVQNYMQTNKQTVIIPCYYPAFCFFVSVSGQKEAHKDALEGEGRRTCVLRKGAGGGEFVNLAKLLSPRHLSTYCFVIQLDAR